MVKKELFALAIAFSLASCSGLKQLSSSMNKSSQPATTTKNPNSSPKFIEKISVTPAVQGSAPSPKEEVLAKEVPSSPPSNSQVSADVETDNYSTIRQKYAILLQTDPAQLENRSLFNGIDEWYGTRYRMGGTSKTGIDCSAFVCAIFASVYGVTLPRMAKDQYKFTKRISRTQLREGDLLFFNTRGGVSHVGIYLQNNKFVHASTSRGVTVSDMFEEYYTRRFIGAGRVEKKQVPLASN